MKRPLGDRVRPCRGCDYWCPMHGERRAYASLGVCAIDGQVTEHNATCSRHSSPAQRDLAALISKPCWKREPLPVVQAQTELAL